MSEEKNVQNERSTQEHEEAFLKRVEQAAARGAKKGGKSGAWLQILPSLIVIGLIAGLILPKINAMHQGFQSLTTFSEEAQSHDLVLEDNSIFGYTAADFEEAILGDSEKLKKLEVFSQEVSDAVTVTDTGFLNWGAFTKMKVITFTGTAVYTVDLGQLRKSDISFNEEEKLITLKIPHPKQEPLNITEDKIMFGDTTNGLLAFGEIKLTPEQNRDIQAEARQKMQEKLDTSNVLDNADRFAILSVWEMYSPIIKGVAKDYSLEVVFR
jgi:hypothetical protein